MIYTYKPYGPIYKFAQNKVKHMPRHRYPVGTYSSTLTLKDLQPHRNILFILISVSYVCTHTEYILSKCHYFWPVIQETTNTLTNSFNKRMQHLWATKGPTKMSHTLRIVYVHTKCTSKKVAIFQYFLKFLIQRITSWSRAELTSARLGMLLFTA